MQRAKYKGEGKKKKRKMLKRRRRFREGPDGHVTEKGMTTEEV